MQGQAQKTTQSFDSFFDGLAHALNPLCEHINCAKPDGYITGMSYDTTIDKIIVVLSIGAHPKSADPFMTEVIVIDREAFKVWADENGLLIIDVGQWDDMSSQRMDFDEYQAEHMDKHDIAEYLEQKNMVNNYAWVYPTPMHNHDANLQRLSI
jgi:hypothetical protein